jgi:hypothetical protein
VLQLADAFNRHPHLVARVEKNASAGADAGGRAGEY